MPTRQHSHRITELERPTPIVQMGKLRPSEGWGQPPGQSISQAQKPDLLSLRPEPLTQLPQLSIYLPYFVLDDRDEET